MATNAISDVNKLTFFSSEHALRNPAVNVRDFKVWSVQRRYEGWNFNSGNYLFTTDTK